jgi:hypothetical protein
LSSILVREGSCADKRHPSPVAYAHREAKPHDAPFALKGQASQSFKDPICSPTLSRASSWRRPVEAQHLRPRPGLQRGGVWYAPTSPCQEPGLPGERGLDSGGSLGLTARVPDRDARPPTPLGPTVRSRCAARAFSPSAMATAELRLAG